MIGQMRSSGIDAIGEVPWGTHFCQFYRTPQDLLEVLVGYFQQGLQNNEFCMWATSEPLEAEEAKHALRAAVLDLDERTRRGQVEFLDYRQWYFPDGYIDAERVLQRLLEKERTALTLGYEGLRFSGDIAWVGKSGWKEFSDYEATIDDAIRSHHILAVCTYSLDRCGGVETLEVLHNHPLALVKNGGKWEVIQSPQQRKTMEMLRQSEQRQRDILDTIPDPAWLKDKEGRFLAANAAWCRFFGIDAEDVLGKTVFEVFPTEIAHKLSEEDRDIVQSCRPLQFDDLLAGKDGRKVWFETIKSPLFSDHGDVVGTSGLARDITERKRAESILTAERDLACRLASSRSLSDIVRLCLAAAIEHSSLECGGIYLVDPAGKLQLACCTGLSSEFVDFVASVQPDSVQEIVLRKGNPLRFRAAEWKNTVCSRRSARDYQSSQPSP